MAQYQQQQLQQATHTDPFFMTYIFTYGNHEFLSGQVRLPLKMKILTAMGQIMADRSAEIQKNNDSAGNCLNEMYIRFHMAAGHEPASIKISVSQNDRGIKARAIEARYTIGNLATYSYSFIRFHLDAPPSRHGYASQGYAPVDWKRRLYRFYNVKDAKKLVIIDRMLHDARGFEETLFDYLQKKHGPEPPPTVDLRHHDRLTAFYHYYNPKKIPQIDSILLTYSGIEEQLFAALVKKYGPEPIIMGSDADSDDSFAYTADTDKEDVDQYPLAVPLMPFIEPLHEHEIQDADPLDVSSDVHFWDNFVNQMPGEAEEAAEGIDCNQETLQQFMRSYPVLFPHILTATCPFKEQVFRANDEFWTYLQTRADAQAEEVEKADHSHVIRCVSSLAPQAQPVWLTRKEWQELVEDWEAAHSLERRVKVGSIALDAEPGAPLRLPTRPPPVAPAPPPPEKADYAMQTVANGATQTLPPPPEAPPSEPSPPRTPHESPVRLVRLPRHPGKSLPVAWPIATLRSPQKPDDDNEPPTTADDTMEPYLRATLSNLRARPSPAEPGTAVSQTQTGGWQPPTAEPAAPPQLLRAGPTPRKAATTRSTAAPQLTRPYVSKPSHPFESLVPAGSFGMPMMTAHDAASPQQESLNAQPLQWDESEAEGSLPGYQPTQTRQTPSHTAGRPATYNPPVSYADAPPSYPSSVDNGERDQYWKSFLSQMQALPTK